MNVLRYTLLSDGLSDRALLAPLDWLLIERSSRTFEGSFANLARLPRPPDTLAARIAEAIRLYPCDLLFVHRDAEREPSERRAAEIGAAIGAVRGCPRAVCVVPVRMMGAWLLLDEPAIRAAAGNPNGRAPLDLPRRRDIEGLPDPKRVLHDALRRASELRGRRARRFNARSAVHRVAELTPSFEPLRGLPAFAVFEQHLTAALAEAGW